MNQSSPATRQPLQRLWWLHPGWLFAVVIGGTIFVAAIQSDHAYQLYGTPKFLAPKHVLLAAVAIVVFVLGRYLAEATGRAPSPTPRQADGVVRFWFWLTTALTLVGYALWLAVGVKNGFSLGMLWELLTTDDPTLGDTIWRDVFVTIKGVTTCAQFGVAALPLGLWLFFRGERQVVWPLGLLLALAAGRAFLFSERLALLELLVPGFIIGIRACVLGRPFTPLARIGLQFAPAIGIVALVLMFGAFEYVRSWRYYRDDFDSYASFTLWRIGGYYTSAHNNAALALETQPPYPLPYATFRQLWTIPRMSSTPFGYQKLTGFDPTQRHEQMLEEYGTPELNNEGGLMQPILDFGLGGFVLFWFGAGFVAGRLYRHYLVGTLAGLTLFPLVFVAILETPRLLYLSYTRSFPALVALLVVLCLTYRSPVNERAAMPAASPV
jgi:hypothetical protein